MGTRACAKQRRPPRTGVGRRAVTPGFHPLTRVNPDPVVIELTLTPVVVVAAVVVGVNLNPLLLLLLLVLLQLTLTAVGRRTEELRRDARAWERLQCTEA